MLRFAPETIISTRLDELQTTASFLCSLDGQISSTRLNEALKGRRDLKPDDVTRLLALTQRLIEIRDALCPLPISFDRPGDVRFLLEGLSADRERIRKAISDLFQG